MRHHPTKRDKSHLPIALGLAACGYSVVDLASVGSGCPDLLVSSKTDTVLIEIKESSADNGRISINQLEFMSSYHGLVAFATTLDDARSIMTRPYSYCLNDGQKARMAQIAYKYRAKSKADNPQIAVKLFETLMEAE